MSRTVSHESSRSPETRGLVHAFDLKRKTRDGRGCRALGLFQWWALQSREADGVRWSRFSVPTFPHRTRKDGAPGCLAGVRLRDTGSLDCARDDRLFRVPTRGRSRLHWWQSRETAGPSTPPSDSLCESDGSARDDKFLLDWRAGTRFRYERLAGNI
jgi:hypothetical protein